jgi:DNA-binding MarR family transcriptional regulator
MNRCLFELILAIKRKCQCNEEQIQQELGLSAAEFNGLIVLGSGQAVPGGEFAGRMGLSPSRGSRVLSRLVTDGLVKAELSPIDRRAISISLTPRGTRMKGRVTERMRACESRICGKLERTSVRRVRDALELLESAL